MPSATTVARRFTSVKKRKAMSEHDMLPSEPVTIVLSQMGWVRSAKGHDIDAQGLSYKAGDSWKASARGQEQPAGGVYRYHRTQHAIDPITLPSARGGVNRLPAN
ncbi:hypothetical protein LNQ52_13470 [Klebsiella pneumoniae subsp. pneumoniae]|nr:hypothetical protein [Klebsiella pneumoniae subsp. pneumoniae]